MGCVIVSLQRAARRSALVWPLAGMLVGLASAQPAPAPPAPEPPPWTQLSRGACGVDAFHRAQPQRDGRGVVVAVLDTGVDMGVAGLRELPGGGVKVVDVQDFSGEGDVPLAPVRLDVETGDLLRFTEGGEPERYRPPPGALPEGTRLWFGELEERRFRGAEVADINDNGRDDDVFGLLVVQPPGGGDDEALVYVDTDADRDLADERPLRSYRLRYDTFTWARERQERQIQPLTCAVNVLLAERKVVVHFDDGGHGTHVAGIAAGYRLLGQEGFDGVAPGAQVISLKIGDNRLAGGATTSGSMQAAFRYAARYAQEHGVHVVCNLSYGVDSELEGAAEIDRFLDDLLRQQPGLVACVSAGNSGPGLSTVGAPAAAQHAITVAALLAADTARDVLGLALPQHALAVFSSRGGELRKPDLVTPGYATSSVPRWSRWDDFWQGTSMASPYAAGLCAVLLSGHPYRPAAPIRSSWVKAALTRSATPVPGYTPLDQGAGLPDLTRAAAHLDGLLRAGAPGPLFDLAVETESPLAPGGQGPAAYWRSTWVPGGDRPQVFRIRPVFAPGLDANARTAFSRRYALSSDVPWLRLAQTQFYLRGEQTAEVSVTYDAAGLPPGLHVGSVRCAGPDDADLRLVSALVVPYRFREENGYRVRLADERVQGWVPRRYFLAVPPGASAMHVRLAAPEGVESQARARELFTPDGGLHEAPDLALDTRRGRRVASHTVLGDDLRPGVWELCITAEGAEQSAPYELEVRFSGLHALPARISAWEPSTRPSGSLEVINDFERPRVVQAAGVLEGVREVHDVVLSAADDEAQVPLELPEDARKVRLRVELSREGFARFTDFAVTVKSDGGAVLRQEALDGRALTLVVERPAGEEGLEVHLEGGFSHPYDVQQVPVRVTADALWARPLSIEVAREGASEVTLYPGIPCRLGWRLERAPPELPEGAALVGRLTLSEAGSGEPLLTVPVERARE